MNGVRVNGEHIWKYYGEKKKISRSPNKTVFFGVLIFFLLLVVSSIVYIVMKKNGVAKNMCATVSTIIYFVSVTFFMFMLFSYRRKSAGLAYAFARDYNNELYLFDYSAPIFWTQLKEKDILFDIMPENEPVRVAHLEKIIKAVNDGMYLEKIMRAEKQSLYGNKITNLFSIKEKRREAEIECYVEGIGMKTLTIPKAYVDYDALLFAFKHLVKPRGYHYEVFEEKYREYTKKMVFSGAVLAGLLAAAIVLWVQCKTYQEKIYQEVTVPVVPRGQGDDFHKNFDGVDVIYEGKQYKLMNNDKPMFMFKEGQKIDAYLVRGKIYANLDGIHTTPPMGYLCMILFFLSAGMGVLTAEIVIRRKKLKLQYRVTE